MDGKLKNLRECREIGRIAGINSLSKSRFLPKNKEMLRREQKEKSAPIMHQWKKDRIDNFQKRPCNSLVIRPL